LQPDRLDPVTELIRAQPHATSPIAFQNRNREGEAMKSSTTRRKNLSGTPHQRELKLKHKLTEAMFQEMLEGLEGLSPEERAILKDPDFITEDEADVIIHGRDLEEPAGELFSLDEVLAENGIPRRRRSA